jgi:hypothetical protein
MLKDTSHFLLWNLFAPDLSLPFFWLVILTGMFENKGVDIPMLVIRLADLETFIF